MRYEDSMVKIADDIIREQQADTSETSMKERASG